MSLIKLYLLSESSKFSETKLFTIPKQNMYKVSVYTYKGYD